MECRNHTGTETDGICKACGQPACLHCAVELKKNYYCKECLEKIVESDNNTGRTISGRPRKNKLLTFFLGAIPGLGHMYLGLIKKGLTIMCLLFVSLFFVILISGESSMSWFPGFFIPTLCVAFISYSIFDSIEIADRINSDKAYYYDNFPEYAVISRKLLENRRSIGIVLIILGAISLCNMLLGYIEELIKYLTGLNLSLGSILLALVFVMFGVYLVKKSSC